MKNQLTIFIFLLQIHAVAAVIPKHLITHADSADRSIQISHNKLSQYLADGANNDEEKVLIFSYWIAKNIRFNLNEAKEHHRTNKTACEVLGNKKAVCEGYSILFQQFCENEGIEAYTVYGYGYGNFLKRTFTFSHQRHAWNAVYVNGKWQILDVTWAASEIKRGKFKEANELFWIFTDAAEFSKSHYPNDPRWQMLRDPRSKKEFWHEAETVTVKNYAIDDSLSILLNRKRYHNELIICASEFSEQQDKHTYIKKLIHLGWSYVGGTFDAEKVKQGIEIFLFAKSESERIDPVLNDILYDGNINKGLETADLRLKNKE